MQVASVALLAGQVEQWMYGLRIFEPLVQTLHAFCNSAEFASRTDSRCSVGCGQRYQILLHISTTILAWQWVFGLVHMQNV